MVSDPLRGERFTLLTRWSAGQVWSALTCAKRSPRYLHGLAVDSCWRSGEPVTLRGGGLTLAGEVLFAEPPHRLDYSIDDPGGSATYVSWRLRETTDGCAVVLYVQESPGTASSEELDDVWLPVLDRLCRLLEEKASAPGS